MTEEQLIDIATAYRAALPPGRGCEFSITPLDRIGQPLWAIGLWGEDDSFADGFGYGQTTAAAQVSALGEAAENYFSAQALRKLPRHQASYRQLVSEGIQAVDPVSLCLNAGCEYDPDQSLVWVEARCYPSQEKILVPIEAAAVSYSDISPEAHAQKWLFTPITNGLGAGLTLAQALTHGILELIQRDGDSVTFRALDQGIAVDLDAVEDPATLELLRTLEEQGIDVIVKLASTDFGIPVLYAVGADRDIHRAPFQLMLSACGEAAHPNRERALAKALREFVSSRARKRFMHGPLTDVASVAPPEYMERLFANPPEGDEPRALRSVTEWVQMTREEFYRLIEDPILTVREHVPFSKLPTSGPALVSEAEGLLRILTSRLQAEGKELLYMDFASGEDGVHVVKAIVPGLEVETMSYLRIGRRNIERLLRQGSDIVSIASAAPRKGALRIHLPTADEKALGGPVWLDPHALERAIGKLYGLYREPNGHTIARMLENR